MVKIVTIASPYIDQRAAKEDMASCPRQTIVLWPNPLPLECGVVRAHDRSLRGGSALGSSSGRLSIQVSHSGQDGLIFLNLTARDGNRDKSCDYFVY